MSNNAEILIAGTGPVGMIAALGLAHAGFAVVLVGPQPRRDDRRTTALMRPALGYLDRLGVLPDVADMSAPLRAMRIVDATSRLLRGPVVTFRASEIGEDSFGLNMPNSALLSALEKAVSATAGIEWRQSTVTAWSHGEQTVTAELADGSAIAAKLAVAADGRDSQARQAAGISTSVRNYPQSALVLNFGHSHEHGFTSTEFHTETGPFTQVPLPGSRSSLVWVVRPETAEELASARRCGAVDPRRAEDAVDARPGDGRAGPAGLSALGNDAGALRQGPDRAGRRGRACVSADRRAGPQSRHPRRRGSSFARPRKIATTPAARRALATYDRRRRPDILARSTAVNLLNISLLSDMLPAQMARSAGLGLLGALAPVRAFFMREGMQPGSGMARIVSSLREQVGR